MTSHVTASTSELESHVATPFDPESIRKDFPVLQQQVHNKPLIYLDNAASAQVPQAVIDAISKYYANDRANVHRGVHELSQRATDDYENARVEIQRFICATDHREIIYTRSATESINLVAQSFVRPQLTAGDEIVISTMEHHSNIVPWQMLRDESGAKLRVAPINDNGELLFEEFEKLLNERTRLVSITHVSNALGSVNPVRKIIASSHSRNIPVLLDGAQAIPHMSVDVRDLDCDFYAFSGHKLFGPNGIGILYGKRELLESMPPYQGGGDMISSVTFEKTIYNQLPYKFEAGTPNIAGAIGLGTAMRYLNRIGLDRITVYEQELLNYMTKKVSAIPSVRLIGMAKKKASVVSFIVDGMHPHDVGTVLDREGVAVRAGHHCAQPVMQRFNVPATTRASLAFYNTREEIDALVAAVEKAKEIFG